MNDRRFTRQVPVVIARTWTQAALALAIFGLFQPQACNLNAFDLAREAAVQGPSREVIAWLLWAGIGFLMASCAACLVSWLKPRTAGIALTGFSTSLASLLCCAWAYVRIDRELELQAGAWMTAGGLAAAVAGGGLILVFMWRDQRRAVRFGRTC